MSEHLERAATVMNVDGWTCDGHEPGAWCVTCRKMQMDTTRRMIEAFIGDRTLYEQRDECGASWCIGMCDGCTVAVTDE